MRSAKLDDKTYLVTFKIGEEVIESLKSFCKKHEIKNASLSAIGALEDPTIAHYNIVTKEYNEKVLEGKLELTNLTGNIAVVDEDVAVHCHVTLADEELHAFGGHLQKGVVWATVEMIVTVYPTSIVRKMDDAVGIKLLDLPEDQ